MYRGSQAGAPPFSNGQFPRKPAGTPAPAPRHQTPGDRDLDGDDFSDEVSKEIFASYICRSQEKGLDHPGDIAEAASLAAIPLPPCDYPLFDSLPAEVVDAGKLSKLQLEGVLYACQAHTRILPDGYRQGFYIGDSTGVGKGRQCSGIILDSYARGRKKHVWVSTSEDLSLDAKRDLTDVNCHINVIKNLQTLDKEQKATGLSKDYQEGVVFTTYSTLVSTNKKGKRLDQLVAWCGGNTFDGVLIFDEAHKSKNYVVGKEAASSKVSVTVIQLQELLPKARVVYCSATGVSEIGHCAYMTRMGLWGPGTPFKDFEYFVDSMKKRGLGFLEMLAMEMKASGLYVSRGLSFKQAEFMELECKLSEEQMQVYDDAVALWGKLRDDLALALSLTKAPVRDVSRTFWSCQQRFFKMLCISLKVPTVVAEAKDALENGQCVVIGLQTTGEASLDKELEKDEKISTFVSTTKEMLLRFIETQFPIQVFEEQAVRIDLAPGPSTQGLASQAANPNESALKKAAVARAVPTGPVDQNCLTMRNQLLESAQALALPPNVLDELINELGGPSAVAEMTGRKGRIVRTATGSVQYELRAKSDSSEMDSLNIGECKAFMKGQKLVAIVSDAASTGISLHADQRAGNQRRRVHLTIELPWSADKAIQQLGRSHRSNQSSAPLYKLVTTDLGGEKRFASAVARRLQSLGALTRGDRRAASGVDLSEWNIDSPLGRKALKKMYDAITEGSPRLPNGVSFEDLASSFVQDGPQPSTAEELNTAMQECVTLMGVNVSESTKRRSLVSDAEMPGVTGAPDKAALYRIVSELIATKNPQNIQLANQLMKTAQKADGEASASDDLSTAEAVGKDLSDVKKFLNRLLGLPCRKQNLIFNYFVAVLAAEVRAAKQEGKYSEGVSDLPGTDVQRAQPPKVVWTDPWSGLATKRHDLKIDRGVSFEVAVTQLEHERGGEQDGFYISKRDMFGKPMYILAIQKPGTSSFLVTRPNTGKSFFEMDEDELDFKYRKIEAEKAQSGWTSVYERSLHSCIHGAECTNGPSCNVGMRVNHVTVLQGAVVPIWGTLEQLLDKYAMQLSKADRGMRVVRVELNDADKVIGIRYPAYLLEEAKALVTAAQLERAAWSKTTQSTVEPVRPVDPKALAKATRPKLTMLSFFKPRSAAASQVETPASIADPTILDADASACGIAALATVNVNQKGSGAAAQAGKRAKQAGASQSDAKRKRSLPKQTNTLHDIYAAKTPARTELKNASRPILNESGGGKSKHSPIDLTDSDC